MLRGQVPYLGLAATPDGPKAEAQRAVRLGAGFLGFSYIIEAPDGLSWNLLGGGCAEVGEGHGALALGPPPPKSACVLSRC